MADKRMFTKRVVESSDFYNLPASTQALYFHLNMDADDDGFNNQVDLGMFKAHATIDDLKLLLAKNFVLGFSEGVFVIKHWRMHNAIRKDTYHKTAYEEYLNMLSVKQNGSYTLGPEEKPCIETVSEPLRNCNETVTQIRLDKNSLDKDSIDKSSSAILVPFEDFWNLWPTGHKVAKEDAIKAWKKLRVDDELFSKMAAALSWQKQSKSWTESGGKYIPHPATWLNGHRWEDERPAEATGGSWMDVAEEMQRDFMEGNQ